MDTQKEILSIVSELKDLMFDLDNIEVEIIETKLDDEKKIKIYKTMLENLLLEYHNVCKNLYNQK